MLLDGHFNSEDRGMQTYHGAQCGIESFHRQLLPQIQFAKRK
jgi:hypothetical protein